MFFRRPNGDIFGDDSTCPAPENVKWANLFKVDEAPIHRVAPVFADAASAVRWLRNVVRRKRNFPWYTRTLMPDLAMDNPFDSVAELGVGAFNNYGKFISDDGLFFIPTFLYRGLDNAQHPLLPTLARCIYPPVALGKLSLQGARETVSKEEMCTHAFTSKFFDDPAVNARFDWLDKISVPRRAAIARHHGFYSWILDFTLDVGIAAWSATGGASGKAPRGGFGIIHVIDEVRLRQVFSRGSFILNYAGYQQRSWSSPVPVDMAIVRKNAQVLDDGNPVGTLIDGEWWEQIKSRGRSMDEFCCDLTFTPGPEVKRMWHQKWCGVEAACDRTTLGQIITAYQVLGRLIDCVLFRQTGVVYEEPSAEITIDYLLPSNDDFSLAVDKYQKRHRLNPGEATRAFLERF